MDLMCIVRLLDKDREVLGWSHIPCETRGNGGIWAKQAFVFQAQLTGQGTAVCYHQPDIHVYHSFDLPKAIDVDAGKVYTIRLDNVLFMLHSEALPLPPVTVFTPQTIGIGSAKPKP